MAALNSILAKVPITITGSRTVSSTDGWTSRVIHNKHHMGCMLQVNRSAETGTATLNAKLQYYNYAAAAYDDLEGAAIVEMGDGTTGTVYCTIYPGLVAADADNSIALNTVNKHCGSYLPDKFKVVAVTTLTSLRFR